MKSNTHPKSSLVIFRDTSCNKEFLIRSTCQSEHTATWQDGKTYPLVNIDVSSASHPVYTGKQKKVAADGRIARFNKRFAGLNKAKGAK